MRSGGGLVGDKHSDRQPGRPVIVLIYAYERVPALLANDG
jgi:hypothetical protein